VLVWDWLQRRLSRFGADGELLETRRFAEDKPQGLPVQPFGDGWLDDREWGQRVDPTPARAALVRLNGDGSVRDTLLGPYPVPEIGWRIVDRLSGVGEMVDPPVFSVRPSWAVLGDSIAWTSGSEPRIEIRDGAGALRRMIELPRPVRPETEADREAHFRRIQQQRAVMERHGDSAKQIWLTEFGWSTENQAPGYEYGAEISEQQQAENLVRAFQIARQEWPWMGVMMVWNLNYSTVVDPADEKFPWSVLNPDWSPRPSYEALRDMPK
jgi:hypothetical protein